MTENVKVLNEICISKGEYGGGFSAIEKKDSAPRYVRITDITENGGLNQDIKGPSGTPEDWEKYMLSEGDILFARSGATVGKTFLYQGLHGKCIYAGYLIRFRPNPQISFSKYIYYYTKTSWYKLWVENKQNAVAQPNINAKQYGSELKIPLPPLPIQKRIAAILDAADAYRQKTKALLEKYDQLAQSLFLEMFGDPVTNPKGWEVVKLGSVGTIDRGKSKHRPRNAPELLGGPYPLIQTGDVANSSGYITEYKTTYSELGLAQSKIWPKGTLCITIAANIAKTGILTFDACFPDSVVGFTASESTTNEYTQFWMSFLQQILEEKAPESAQKNINLAILRSLDFPLPPIRLQEEFVKRIKTLETQKQEAQTALQKAEDLFNSLLQRAFNGELAPEAREEEVT